MIVIPHPIVKTTYLPGYNDKSACIHIYILRLSLSKLWHNWIGYHGNVVFLSKHLQLIKLRLTTGYDPHVPPKDGPCQSSDTNVLERLGYHGNLVFLSKLWLSQWQLKDSLRMSLLVYSSYTLETECMYVMCFLSDGCCKNSYSLTCDR